MKICLSFIAIIFFVSCNQSTNSNSFDRAFSENIGIDRSTAEGERLFQAYTSLKNNCMSCHSGYHNTWSSYNTSQAWINAGLVESNDAYASSIIIRLKNIGGNMPKDNPQIPEEDFDKIIEWIEGI
ncbi:MAG: cytochrome c [Bacteriovoracaceae bacterium]|jgi:mono/diheme cytochrome c family protein|nr:cytochrome c [Bacteriovoracaceae bacterium]